MKPEIEINENKLNNIYDRYSNVYVIEVDENITIEDKLIGIVRLSVKDKSKKQLKINQFVKFSYNKSKYKSNLEANNRRLYIVDTRWVSIFDPKPNTPVIFPVLVSYLDIKTNQRVYKTEMISSPLTMNQYIKKRLFLEYKELSYGEMVAYENFVKRFSSHKDRYRAINETAKIFLIKHDDLVSLISKINNSKKKYKKDWLLYRQQENKNNETSRYLDKLIEQNNEVKNAKVINFRDVKF